MESDAEKKTSLHIIFIVSILLAMVAIWFGMSNISYDSATPLFPFKTAGRFVLWSPIFLGLAFCYAALLHYIFRRAKKLIAWTAMLLISVFLISSSIAAALPYNQIQIVLGPEAASHVTISKLQISDTFQDGRFFIGIIRGPNNLIQIIEKTFPLKSDEKTEIDPDFAQIFYSHCPEPITVYFDGHRSFTSLRILMKFISNIESVQLFNRLR